MESTKMKPMTFFKTDEGLEENGVKIVFAEDQDGKDYWIKVRRAGYKGFENYIDGLRKRYKYQIEKGTLTDEQDKEITRKAWAKTMIPGWSWYDEDGNELDCTPENIEALFEADKEIYKIVRENAFDFRNFAIEDRKADEKNSKRGSRGSASGVVTKIA